MTGLASISPMVMAGGTVLLAAATVWLAMATAKSVRKSSQSIELIKDHYKLDNTPLLVFDFSFYENIFVPAKYTRDNVSVRAFDIMGTLSNISKASAQQITVNIIRTDSNDLNTKFDKDIFLANGSIGEQTIAIAKTVKEDDIVDKNRVGIWDNFRRPFSILTCENVRENKLCPFVIIFSYQNRWGDTYHSVYGLRLGNGLPNNVYSESVYFGHIEGELTKEKLESIKVEFGVVKAVAIDGVYKFQHFHNGGNRPDGMNYTLEVFTYADGKWNLITAIATESNSIGQAIASYKLNITAYTTSKAPTV